jgi:hypothetical protein
MLSCGKLAKSARPEAVQSFCLTCWVKAFSLFVILSHFLIAAGCGGASSGSPPLPPSFTLSPSPASVSVDQGASGQSTITVVPANGFSGSVSLAATGMPTGVTASFSPTTTASTSTLNLTTNSSAATGTFSITVTGTSGVLKASTGVGLTSTAASGFTLSSAPSAFSIQQGAGRSATITVNPANGFSGKVSLSASGLPSGVTASFNPSSTTSTSIVSFTVSSSASAGTATVTITGQSGSLTQTTTIGLTIIASPPQGGLPSSFFALSNVDPSDDPTADGMSYGGVGHPDRLAWPYIEPSQNNFDFTLYDQYVAMAPREGPNGIVAVMDLALGMTPQWATSDTRTCRTLRGGVVGCQAPPPMGQPYWQDFITALVHHYDGSTAARPHIKYYEIWNEWNLQDASNGYWIGPIPDLVALQTTACSIIHSTDTFSAVLTPSTVGSAVNANDHAPMDLATYFSYGGNQCPGGPNNLIDGVSFHGIVGATSLNPYPLPGEGCTGQGCYGTIVEITNSYRQVLDLNGLQAAPLLDTEGGFEAVNIADTDQRAAWLAQFYALQAGLFSSDQLQWSSWFTWGVPGVAGNIETANKTPDAAGVAYSQVFAWLYGRRPSACAQSGKLWTCLLTGASGYQAEILWDDAQTCTGGTCTTGPQTAPSWAVKMRDLTGTVTTITGGSTVQVGLKPVILESQ